MLWPNWPARTRLRLQCAAAGEKVVLLEPLTKKVQQHVPQRVHHRLHEKMTEVKVTVADLINSELLKAGTVVVLRTLEGVITDQGTIRAAGANGLGVVDYRTPTAWSRVVCKINSSGWRQVKLKDEKTSLYTLKQKYIQRKGGDAKEGMPLLTFSHLLYYSPLLSDKPPKRQKTPNKSHVPNTNHIPQQLQFITSPLQQQLNHQPHQLVLPMAIVTPQKPQVLLTQGDPSDPNGGAPVSLTLLLHLLSPTSIQRIIFDFNDRPPLRPWCLPCLNSNHTL